MTARKTKSALLALSARRTHFEDSFGVVTWPCECGSADHWLPNLFILGLRPFFLRIPAERLIAFEVYDDDDG